MARWDIKGIPHKGWNCVEVVDMEDDDNVCEMCGNERIRYAHMMVHPDYPRTLMVGCVCAEKMLEDYINPRKKQSEVKNMALRRKNFDKHVWDYNPRKHSYTKSYKGKHVTIVQCRFGTFGIFCGGINVWKYEGQPIRTFEDAEKVAFEIFEAAG